MVCIDGCWWQAEATYLINHGRQAMYLGCTAHADRHTETRRFACSKCPMRFRQSGSLSRHLKVHAAGGEHKCEQCNATFNVQSSLSNHIRKAHKTLYKPPDAGGDLEAHEAQVQNHDAMVKPKDPEE